MQYFKEEIKHVLKDFVEYCNIYDKDKFNLDLLLCLTDDFLKSKDIETNNTTSEPGPSTSTSSVKSVVDLSKTKKVTLTSKTPFNSKEISVSDFNNLSIAEIQHPRWPCSYLVSALKTLLIELTGKKFGKITKTQLVDELLKHKTNQQEITTVVSEDTTTVVSEDTTTVVVSVDDNPILSNPGPKRRSISASLRMAPVIIIQKYGLDLVLCKEHSIYLVLSAEKLLKGFIPKENFDADQDSDKPNILKSTNDVIRFAKNMGISFDPSELPDY